MGELIERAYGLNTVYQQINANLFRSVFSLFWGGLSLLLIFYYNIQIGLIVLISALLLTVLLVMSLYVQTLYFSKMAFHDGRSSNLFLQIINALKKIRSAHKEEIFFKKWLHHTESRLYFFSKAQILSIITGSFQSYFIILLTMMIYISFVASETGATLSNFIIINGLIGNFIASFTAITSVVGNYLYLLPLYKRIKPVLETIPEKVASSYQDVLNFKEIVFENVSFSYDVQNKEPTLSNISLKIQQGKFTAIVGTSGSGKTTLLRLLLGLELPQSGKILIDNIDSISLSYDSLRQQCGVVLQSTDLIPGTILENITGFASQVCHEQVANVLQATNLTREINDLPMGLQTLVLEQGQAFSLGQRQRILIARALYHAPRMLVLDEATSALDNMSQKIIYENLAQLNITRFVIAHRLSTIKQADYIYVIDQGEVVEEGTFTKLMKNSGHFFQLVNKQT